MTDSWVPAALQEIRSGRAIVVLDDVGRKNEGDLIFAAELATPELLAFVVRHTSGFVCTALTPADCDRLRLHAMPVGNRDKFGTAYRVTVDATGTGTGISASARARTIAALGSAGSGPRDFTRPGHVVPLQAREGGVLRRPGHTEAAVDLATLAGRQPVGGLCGIVSTRDIGAMAQGAELHQFAADHGLVIVTIDDIVRYRLQTDRLVKQSPHAGLPTGHAPLRAIGYRDAASRREHIALLASDTDFSDETPVYVHQECLAGDVFGARECECGSKLADALSRCGEARQGVIVYLRSPQPRNCPPHAALSTHVAAAILQDLGVRRARLLHADHAQHAALHARGILTTDVPRHAWSTPTIA